MTEALARQEQTGLARVDIASELPAIFTLASKLVQAHGFLPDHLKSEGAIVAALLAGRELGLQPMVSLRSIYIVKGKVTLAADVMLALMIGAGLKFKWLEQTDKVARLRLDRPGFDSHEQTFTIEDANRAGLVKDGGAWKSHPAAMLRARCVSAAGRAYAPDILAGVYVQGELDEDIAPVRVMKPRRTLDDVAEVRSTIADQPLGQDAPRSAYSEAVEPNMETGEIPYGFDQHLAFLPQCGVDALQPWVETLAELSPSETQLKHARTAFKGRCKELNVDASAYKAK